MNSRDALKVALDMSEYVSMAYLGDLTDEDLMLRPHAACNHINWQIGHLVAGEHSMMNAHVSGGMPALPTGFAEKYTKETASSNDSKQFASKEQLLATYKEQRAATLKALAAVTDSQLDNSTGLDYAPTLGALYSLQSSHWLMHCGQWVIVRRNLGKPVVI